jgi:carbon monoxide dehydrogenase subunit G
MHLNATYTFNAPVETVWALLMDTESVAGCLPGAKGLKPLGDDRYEAVRAVAVAAISGNYKGTITLQDKNPPQSYRLLVDGSGRPGFVKGQAQVTLLPDGERTTVQIEADADVGGLIARVGQRLLDGVARMTMDRFYACLAKRVETSRPPAQP